MNNDKAEIIIIGGGLAGMMAALRLIKNGNHVALIDHSLPQADGKLGGFAKFSGAKFSLPPAGLGLLPVVGSLETLELKIHEVWSILELEGSSTESSHDSAIEQSDFLGHGTVLRKYSSAVLTPSEIDDLVSRLTVQIGKFARIINAQATKLVKSGTGWDVHISTEGRDPEIISANAVFYAGGRLSSAILVNAGASTVAGKGLDLGLRVEFADNIALRNLRALGADAKLINGNCRTFCLNSPGLIYRYPFKNITIPGGVVASETEKSANVGLLVRVQDKKQSLRKVVERCAEVYGEILTYSERWVSSSPLDCGEKLISAIYGEEVLAQLRDFSIVLDQSNMIDWSSPHKIHLPLIDWHWDVFCRPDSHRTSLDGVFALGDSAGHARGLMQAGLSGWIAAEEYINANAN